MKFDGKEHSGAKSLHVATYFKYRVQNSLVTE